MTDVRDAFGATRFAPAAVVVQHANDHVLLSSRHTLRHFARCTGEFLEHWATEDPLHPFLLERTSAGEWRGLNYVETLREVHRVGAWLLAQEFSPERPVAILSENSIEHAVLTLACLHVGVPVAPVSPAYSLLSKDYGKLRAIFAALSPAAVYAGDATRFAPALRAVRQHHSARLLLGSDSAPFEDGVPLATLSAPDHVAAVERAFSAIKHDTIAKILFTSGSTGEPKGVINTQRMLCANQQAMAQVWPLICEKPVLVDWLPWHHTFGGNHNFNIVLRNGGTLYIDRGRPLAGEFEATLSALRQVAPTLSLNVPRAYDLLVSALRDDLDLRERFFSRMQLMMYAGASLPQHLWTALRELSRQTLGRAVPLASCWGLTETAPAASICFEEPLRAGVIGLPVPGSELKLVPNGVKLEARVRGPNVSPGYWRRPDLTAASFDEQGFFKTGDAVGFVDQEHPERGLFFDGRVAEDFKLSTATWVNVGTLRLQAIAALAPIAQDVVVTGQDRDEIGLLIIPNVSACRSLCAEPSADMQLSTLLAHRALRSRVAAGLAALERASTGSSTCVRRALLLTEPPSIDAGEITDKGYINQRAVLERRADLIELLYRHPADAAVITLPPQQQPSLADRSERDAN